MRNLMFSLISLTLYLSSLAYLQADEREAFERFANYIVGGTWHGEDADGTPLQHTYRWALGKQFLYMVENDTALHIAGVDPVDDTHTRWEFRADGSVSISKSRELEGGPNSTRFKLLEGANFSAGTILRGEYGEDQIKLKADEGSVLQVWTREPLEGDFPSLASDPPKEIPNLMKAISGPKWVSGGLSGNKVYGTTLGQWILDGNFFLFTSTFLRKDEAAWGIMYVFGKDPETGEPTGWEFGGFEAAVTKWKLTNQGMTITGKATLPGNTTFTYSGTHSISDDGLVKYTASGKMSDESDPTPYGWTYYPVK